MLHRMQMRQFIPRQPLPDVQIRLQEWTPDREVNINYDDMNARAWERE